MAKAKGSSLDKKKVTFGARKKGKARKGKKKKAANKSRYRGQGR